MRQRIQLLGLLGGAILLAFGEALLPTIALAGEPFQLSPEHIAAIQRQRRVVVNFDTGFGAPSVVDNLNGLTRDQLVRAYFSMMDEPGVVVDSVWWCWIDGNCAPRPSKVLPVWEHPTFKKWWDAGFDPLTLFVDETRRRGKEVFYSYRLNGTDMGGRKPLTKPLYKEEHPEWLIKAPWEVYGNPGYWNFIYPEVREYKLRILREVADNYDYDGFEIDFARGPISLPSGAQWEHREHMTEFMRMLRRMTLAKAKERGRPFLIAARVPENVVGCHFDGFDVGTWAKERLVDMFVVGNRALEVDLAGFRRLTAGTEIKLYPCIDDHHSSDGYAHPPIEVFRGIFANWWHQGADGIQTFNFDLTMPDAAKLHGLPPRRYWKTNIQSFREMASPETLRGLDKVFVVERRGGGHGPSVVPNADDWSTPRAMYFLTNMFASLPAELDSSGKVDTQLFAYVADDLAGSAKTLRDLSIRVLLSDPNAEDAPKSERFMRVTYPGARVPDSMILGRPYNLPPRKGIERSIELRLNNALLTMPSVSGGWLEYKARPTQFAVGENLVSLRVTDRNPKAEPMLIEMIEIHIDYE